MSIDSAGSNPTKARESESNERIYVFLKEHPVGVLATVDPNGNPHAVVVYFSVDESFRVRFTTKRDTKKHDNLQHNNHAMMLVYDAASQTTVQVTGTARDISDTPEAQDAFHDMLKTAEQTSDDGEPPISKLDAGHYVTYGIDPLQIRMAIFARPDPGGYDVFETIDFQP